MNTYVTSTTIKQLREQRNLTQSELADLIGVSSKTISKWETAKGLPDVSLLQPLAQALNISLIELMNGEHITNKNISANMLRCKFHVCPVCGNIIHSMGEAVIHCHGVQLTPAQAEETDENHKIFIEKVEDDYYIQIEHEMTKTHYISFVAYCGDSSAMIFKQYPEWNLQATLPLFRMGKLVWYCNKCGLLYQNIR